MSSGLGKLPEELPSKPGFRDVVELLYESLRNRNLKDRKDLPGPFRLNSIPGV